MKLEEWMKENRWTKAAFAREMMISEQTIYWWTKKNRKPSKHMAKMIEIFTEGEVTAEEMLKQESWSKNDRDNNRGETISVEIPPTSR